MDKPDWIAEQVTQFVKEYGAVPPPWFIFANTHPYDISWRMGAGEVHLMVFHHWWKQQKGKLDQTQRIAYFQPWPPPPRWLTWAIDLIWDIELWELDDLDSFDYSPYFARIVELGWGTQTDFEQDLADPKWLAKDS